VEREEGRGRLSWEGNREEKGEGRKKKCSF